MRFEISDWVQASTDNGELVHGFIEVLNPVQSIARIFVVKSDNEESIGKPVVVPQNAMKKLPELSPDASEEIESLIDLSLLTWDEQWFNELSEKLIALQSDGEKKESQPIFTSSLMYERR